MPVQAFAVAVGGPLAAPIDEAEAVRAADLDQAARLGAAFDRHHQRLYRLARRLCRTAEDARDVVQDTFLRAARSPSSMPDGIPNEEAWLVRVLINICRDRWRMRETRARLDPRGDAARPLTDADPESALVARSVIWNALDALPPRRRAMLVMYELEGATIPAIAKTLGVAPVTVRWHLARGRREMAKIIGDEQCVT
jgi:RNA polymerase sigma-70 factor (ECF subfamily)